MKYWTYFRKNYLWTSLWMIGLLIAALLTIEEQDLKFIAVGFFAAIVGVLFIASYFAWKKFKQ